MVSKTAKIVLPFPPLVDEGASGAPNDWTSEPPSLLGLSDKSYRDYIEHLVQSMPCEALIAAGAAELQHLEEHCVVTGQELIDSISPSLDAFFDRVQSESPAIWRGFTCQDAVALINTELHYVDEALSEALCGGEQRDEVVFGLFLYCSYILAMAVHRSPDLRYEIGIGSKPLLN